MITLAADAAQLLSNEWSKIASGELAGRHCCCCSYNNLFSTEMQAETAAKSVMLWDGDCEIRMFSVSQSKWVCLRHANIIINVVIQWATMQKSRRIEEPKRTGDRPPQGGEFLRAFNDCTAETERGTPFLVGHGQRQWSFGSCCCCGRSAALRDTLFTTKMLRGWATVEE